MKIQENVPHYKNGVPISNKVLHEDNWLDEINKLQKPKQTTSFYFKNSSYEEDTYLEENEAEDVRDNRYGYY